MIANLATLVSRFKMTTTMGLAPALVAWMMTPHQLGYPTGLVRNLLPLGGVIQTIILRKRELVALNRVVGVPM